MCAAPSSTKPSRKRTLDDENSDPCRFLRAYYEERGIPESPEDDAALLTDCVRRAEQARESFKRWRASDDNSSGQNGEDSISVHEMSAHEKYQRRLVNNRRSAAASRVYQEVLRREHTHALRNIVNERNDLKSDVARLSDSLLKLKEENERLVAAEEAAAARGSSVVGSCDVERSETTLTGQSSSSTAEPDPCLLEQSDRFKAGDPFGFIGSDKHSPHTTATVTAAAFVPLSPPNISTDAVASVARALLPMFGSQSQSQDDTDDGKGGLVRNQSTPLYSVGVLSSQLSQGESVFTLRCNGNPSSWGIDEFGESMESLVGSQGIPSQGFASQGTATAGC